MSHALPGALLIGVDGHGGELSGPVASLPPSPGLPVLVVESGVPESVPPSPKLFPFEHATPSPPAPRSATVPASHATRPRPEGKFMMEMVAGNARYEPHMYSVMRVRKSARCCAMFVIEGSGKQLATAGGSASRSVWHGPVGDSTLLSNGAHSAPPSLASDGD